MIRCFTFIIYNILKFFEIITKNLTKRSYLVWLKYFLEQDSYKQIKVFNKKVKFFSPNHVIDWRVDTFYTKEPETLEWIRNFNNSSKIIFWDIGANIGLYSIYNAIVNNNSTTFSFEPSTSNLRVLSRNIYINNLHEKISIIQQPLFNKANNFSTMNESDFLEGSALHTFSENFDHAGKKRKGSRMKYNLLATTIDNLVENKILSVPNYIKIDVDGIEHLILKGAIKTLKNKKIKSISIEVNENFKKQFNVIMNLMKKNNFSIIHKKNAHGNIKKEFINTFNYIFERK